MFQHFDWNLTHRVLFLDICPASLKPERPALTMHISRCSRTDISSWKLSAKASLMFSNPFTVRSFCKLNHISVSFISNSMKVICKKLIPFQESHVFFERSPVFWAARPNFQHNIEVSIKTAWVSRLSFHFLWQWQR